MRLLYLVQALLPSSAKLFFLGAIVALFGIPVAHASLASVSTSASTSASQDADRESQIKDTEAETQSKSAAGGASASASAFAGYSDLHGSLNSKPTLRVTAYGIAGGDQNEVEGKATAQAEWEDKLTYENPLFIPPFLMGLYATFQCHIDGTLTGPIGAANASLSVEVDRSKDVNGDFAVYGLKHEFEGPKGLNGMLRFRVPANAFLYEPVFVMGITVDAGSTYDPSEARKWVGDGSANFGSTFALDTIYFTDEHGNPVAGLDDIKIVGDNGPYPMGAPAGGFLQEIVVLDRFGRRLNEHGVTLVDWEGQIANPAIRIQIVPPSDTTFPATATISCSQPRIYFDEPSTADASGPTKVLTFTNNTPQPLLVSIFPDRDGADEDYPITVEFTAANGASRTLIFNAHVIDQDQPARPVELPITVDFSRDQTGFFADASTRALYQQLANDWAYFFANPGLDPVPAGAETTFIWNPTGFINGSFITNSNAYRGYLLYAYGIDQSGPPYRSGGEPSSAGGFLSVSGQSLNLRRSGGQELEIKGNYNELGWYLPTGDDDWWKASNLGDVQNDLGSIPHHEMGHAFIFNPAQPAFAHFKSLGSVQDASVLAYQGAYPTIDSSDHLTGSIDRLSGKGAFGYEYYGTVPARRWLITKLDLLVAQAIGYPLRDTSPFIPAQILITTLPRGGVSGPYDQALQARGGVPFYRWSISSGALPPGLALDSFTGVLTGVPTTAGNYQFRVRLEDYDDAAAPVEASFTIRVEAVPFEITGVQATPTPQVSYSTSVNHTYRVDYSEDLKVWTTLTSNVPGTDGIVTTADPAGLLRPKRFYRVIEL